MKHHKLKLLTEIIRIVFLQKTDVSPFKESKDETSQIKITNRNNAHFSSKESSSYTIKISSSSC